MDYFFKARQRCMDSLYRNSQIAINIIDCILRQLNRARFARRVDQFRPGTNSTPTKLVAMIDSPDRDKLTWLRIIGRAGIVRNELRAMAQSPVRYASR